MVFKRFGQSYTDKDRIWVEGKRGVENQQKGLRQDCKGSKLNKDDSHLKGIRGSAT